MSSTVTSEGVTVVSSGCTVCHVYNEDTSFLKDKI